MAQLAIDAAEKGDYTVAEELHYLLKSPYAEQSEYESKWFQKGRSGLITGLVVRCFLAQADWSSEKVFFCIIYSVSEDCHALSLAVFALIYVSCPGRT